MSHVEIAGGVMNDRCRLRTYSYVEYFGSRTMFDWGDEGTR
jgi:hypothetical protein